MSDVGERLYARRNNNLTNKVASLAEQISPSANNELNLNGVALSKPTFAEFKEVFKQPLNFDVGANLTISFDQASGKMVLDRATFALSGTAIAGTLERTESSGYVQSFLRPNGTLIASNLPEVDYTSDELLGALAIAQPDMTNVEAYRLWRADLLSLANGWRIDEYTDFIDDLDPEFTVDTESSIRQRMLPGIIKYFRVLNSEIYGKRRTETDDSHVSVQSVAQVIEASLPSDDESDRDTLHFYTLAELHSYGYDHLPVELSRKVFKSNNSLPNALVPKPAELILSDRDELDADTYKEYLSILEATEEAVKRAKDSKPTQP